MQILVIEGLHPFVDKRVADLVDFKIYLDISDDIKFAWKIQVRAGRADPWRGQNGQKPR